MQWKAGLASVALMGLTACDLSSDLPTSNYAGLFRVLEVEAPEGGFTLSPVAIFFGGQANLLLPASQATRDSCSVGQYPSPTSQFVLPPFPVDDPATQAAPAGESITVTTDLASDRMLPVEGGLDADTVGVVYRLANDARLPFSLTDPIEISIAGASAGFPATTINVLPSRPLTLGPIDTAPEGPLRLTWTPVDGNESSVFISLRYSSRPDLETPDLQIMCAMRDDGVFTLPDALTEAWANSSPSARSVAGYRWRTTFVSNQHGDVRSTVDVITHVDFEKSTFP